MKGYVADIGNLTDRIDQLEQEAKSVAQAPSEHFDGKFTG